MQKNAHQVHKTSIENYKNDTQTIRKTHKHPPNAGKHTQQVH